MAYLIQADESLSEGVLRIAAEELDRALAALTGQAGMEPAGVVHDVRKRFKRLRALVRLARGGLGGKLADRENARYRDAGRPLSGVRDAEVLLESFDGLMKRIGEVEAPESAAPIRSALARRREAATRRVLEDAKALEEAAVAVREARDALDFWQFDADGWGVLRKGAERIYRAGALARREAVAGPTDEALHEWRKRVKDLWYLLEILRPIRPAYTETMGDRAHKLADALGDDHDLAVLRQVLLDPAEGLGDGAAVGPILRLIDRRRAGLQGEAFSLGSEAYREPPEVFVDRLRAYWRAWRSEIEAARFE